jgi:superfamily II RNA helicase
MAFTPTDFEQQLPFTPDAFQQEAIAHIAAGKSVVVCAPTGSGKTLIAEYAAYRTLDSGKKLFYTTPLKALSNQKFNDLKDRFGEPNVGLLTGDMAINRDARMVVMTTEVFRNMLYGLTSDSRLLDGVEAVVLDECHYMNDRERGTVWEECIIYCPRHIQLIALSATVANAEELTRWMDQEHNATELVYSDFRPVPLRFSYYVQEKLQPLFESAEKGDALTLNKQLKGDTQLSREVRKKHTANRPDMLIKCLAEKDMLPAIVFVFSRRGCDDALKLCKHVSLLTDAESTRLNQLIDDYLEQNPYLQDHNQLTYLRLGMASHHAGLLPALKVLVENLFQQGLLKVVFATETLAAGINMPARTTVISSISKRTSEGHRLLTASEFMQMSGRAGRRGMDVIGYVVVMASAFKSAKEVAALASSPPEPLNSQFSPTYGMVLNLLSRYTLDEAEFLLNKSFGQFTAGRRLKPLEKEIRQKSMELAHYLEFECPHAVSEEDFHTYLKQRGHAHTLREQHVVYKKQLKRHPQEQSLREVVQHHTDQLNELTNTLHESPCHQCKVLHTHQRNEQKIRHLQTFLKSLNAVHHQESELYWRHFLNITNLLKKRGYLSEQNRPTADGQMMGQIRAENELFVAEIIKSGLLNALTPGQLAAVISSIVTDNSRYEQEAFSISPEVIATTDAIEKLQRTLTKQQDRHHINLPINSTPLVAGLTEAWAQDMPWDKMIETSKLDEGDVVRMLRRTCDVLRQIARIPEVPSELTQVARQAHKAIYKDPIQEAELANNLDDLV